MLFVYWFLWPPRLVWLLVCCLYKEVYVHIFKCVSFWLHGCCGEWEGGPVNQVNHTSWVAVVSPTHRPKSVRNCCLIELFCAVVCVVTLPFWHFCCVGAFVIGLGQISSFLSVLNPHQGSLVKQSSVNIWKVRSNKWLLNVTPVRARGLSRECVLRISSVIVRWGELVV